MQSHVRSLGLGLVLLIAAKASAAPSVAVLGIEPVDVSDAVAQQLTDVLRRSVRTASGHRQVQGKDLVELKMVFGCDGESPTCLAQAGRSLRADKLLFGLAKKGKGDAIAVELRLLDVDKKTIVATVEDQVRKEDFQTRADLWLVKLFGGEVVAPTGVTITSEPAGAEITLDAKTVGKTPLELTTLGPGQHPLVATLEGFEIVSRTITVVAGQKLQVSLQLVKVKPPAPLPPPVVARPPIPAAPLEPEARKPSASDLRTSRIVTGVGVGTLVLGGVFAGVSIWSWYTYTNLENDLSDRVALLVPSRAATAAESKWLQHPNCSPPSSLAEFGNIQAFANDCKNGQRYANATSGLVAAATIFGVGGLAMIIAGAQLDAKVRKNADKKTAFRIVPNALAAPGYLGLGAAGTF